jgi:hypothetical protein
VGTAYCGHLEIYGNAEVGMVIDEALVRLNVAKNGVGNFELKEIKEVFFGSIEANTDGQIGCRDLQLEKFQKCSGKQQLQYLIFFSTDSGYPDYFSKYLVDHLKIVDPKVKINLNCVGDGIYKVKEVITPSI